MTEEKMMKKFAKVLAAGMALTLFVSACGGGNKPNTTGSAGTAGSEQASGSEKPSETGDKGEAFDGPVHQDPKVYTYSEGLAAGPATWSPHTWETNAEGSFQELLDVGFVTPVYDSETDNYKWQYEMATEIKDITADFADKEKYGIPDDATEQYVYEITLRDDLEWEDGTKINADSFVYSMQQLLNSEMKNYRANTYFTGEMAIVNAEAYFNNDKVGQPIYTDVMTDDGDVSEGATAFFSVDQPVYFFGDSATKLYEGGYKETFTVDGVDLYAKYKDKGYVEVTDEVQNDLTALAKAFGDDNETAWKEFTVFQSGTYEEMPWENVGFVKTGDLSFQYILQNPSSEFNFFIGMGSGNWLVHEGKYEAGKKKVENLVATDYFTDADTTISYGPYRMVSYEKDRQIVLERNENFFGYKLEEYNDQWQADNLRFEIIPEHATQLQMFLQGSLDSVSLESADMETYKMSNYLVSTAESYTQRIIFATSPETLKQLEKEAGDGANKQVLQYKDFRKAISLSIDREKLTTEATAGYKPALFLFNDLYYYDIENNPDSVYRNTPEAKQAILDLYGIEVGEGKDYPDVDTAYAAITGYDVDQAKELFQSVYEKAIEDGTYTDGQDIKINVMATASDSLNADYTKQNDLMNQFIDQATKGTGFEGKISFKYLFGAQKRYEDVALGRIECILGAWGGAYFYPFSTIRVYTEPDYMGGIEKIHESNGWDPTKEKLTITYDFNGDGTEEELTKTFQDWAKSINGAGEYANDNQVAMAIMAKMEAGILGAYQCIPYGTMTDNSLRSMRLEYGTYVWNPMYAYGGLRFYTFTMDDTEWANFVKEQGGTLNYA